MINVALSQLTTLPDRPFKGRIPSQVPNHSWPLRVSSVPGTEPSASTHTLPHSLPSLPPRPQMGAFSCKVCWPPQLRLPSTCERMCLWISSSAALPQLQYGHRCCAFSASTSILTAYEVSIVLSEEITVLRTLVMRPKSYL